MRYEIPKMFVLAAALDAVKSQIGSGKPNDVLTHAIHPNLAMTNGAYEADE